MAKSIKILQEALKKLSSTGFSAIFFSNVLSKAVAFLGGIVVVRILSKADYGIYSYIINCYGILMLLGDLGCGVAAMQYCSENYNRKELFDAFFIYGLKSGFVFSGITTVLIFLSPWYYPFVHEEAKALAQMLCLMPLLTTLNSFVLINLRIRLQNKKYAAVSLFSVFVHYGFILPLAYFWGIKGAVLSNYAIAFATLLYGLFSSRQFWDFEKGFRLKKNEKNEFLKLAFASQLNNGIEHGLMLLDVFLIGLIIVNAEAISSYKIATTIPSALVFIPSSIMTYAVPYFARNCSDLKWVSRNYKKLILGSGAVNLLVSLPLIALAKYVVPLIFGSQYADAVPCFIILMIGFFFSGTFRMPSANVIYTQHKVKVNIRITIIAGILNCILDVVLINYFGSMGAAFATLLVNLVVSAISFTYMMSYLKRPLHVDNI